MEIVTKIDQKKNLRIHTVTGYVSKDKLLPKLLEMYASPDFHPEMNALWDVRSADFGSVAMSDVVETCAFVQDQWEKRKQIRVAFLVATEVDFTLATMYETLMEDNAMLNNKIFRDEEDAMAWITT